MILTKLKKIYSKDLMNQASSLSFHTILAIVPMLIIFFSLFLNIASFQKHTKMIKEFIFSSIMPSSQESFIINIEKFISNGTSISTIGLFFVVMVSVMFFKDYEHIVSKIFNTPKRSVWQGISTYWTLITFTPLGLGLSFYLSNFLFDNWQLNIVKILPFFIIWFMMFVVILISPNKKLKIVNVAFVSLLASGTWYTLKNAFVFYVTYNKTYTSLYGSFSTFMFFLMWIYLSWIIFLYALNFIAYLEKRRDNKKKSNITLEKDI
ncbi:MAG: Ribonuclease BN (EC [uncultured Campylobacterales bacterium]|uniref:Ribonuclease BN (EC) n=1 Tax=uncultured Campylobacterales bacterium TaxID=352960 RepID=A0A6S6SMN1_9BACT|nr:MAG: Ribonuclease BN (EC [uncultured Campylobacterales bacterium]